MNIKYRQLKAFLLAAESGSFKAASDVLAVTQPSFSALIRELEEDVGVELFARTTRSCALTEAGAGFLREVRPALEELEMAYQRINEVGQGTLGKLHLASIASISLGMLTRAIAAYSRDRPGVQVRLSERQNAQVLAAVRDNEVELGFACQWQDDENLDFLPLFSDELLLLVPPAHPLVGRRPAWRELENHPLIVMGTGLAEFALRANGVTRRAAYEVEHMATAVSMVRHGMGVSIIPSSVLPELALGALECVHIEGPWTHRQLGVAYRRNRKLSAAARAFLSMLVPLQNDTIPTS